MTIIFHPRIRTDLRQILEYYDERSDTAGDRFFAEFRTKITLIRHSPLRYPPLDALRRRCNFTSFPFHLVYEIDGDNILITVLRHHSRHPAFGLRRKWR